MIDFHEQKEVNGIRFWPYVAGHVLGACMFMIEIAGSLMLTFFPVTNYLVLYWAEARALPSFILIIL